MNSNIKQTHQVLKELIDQINFHESQQSTLNSNVSKVEIDSKLFVYDAFNELLDDPSSRLLYASNLVRFSKTKNEKFRLFFNSIK